MNKTLDECRNQKHICQRALYQTKMCSDEDKKITEDEFKKKCSNFTEYKEDVRTYCNDTANANDPRCANKCGTDKIPCNGG